MDGCRQSIRRRPSQWVIIALVEALNVVAIEALVTDLHPGAQRAHGRKLLDGKPNRLRRGGKAAIAQRLSRPALALAHEQLGGDAVVECGPAVGRHSNVPTLPRISASVSVGIYHGNSMGKELFGQVGANLVEQPASSLFIIHGLNGSRTSAARQFCSRYLLRRTPPPAG